MKRLIVIVLIASAGTASADSPPRPLPIASRPLPIAAPFRPAPLEELPPIPFKIDPADLMPAARSVPQVQPFRGSVSYGYYRSHDCPHPNCGREQTVQRFFNGQRAPNGGHWHACPANKDHPGQDIHWFH